MKQLNFTTRHAGLTELKKMFMEDIAQGTQRFLKTMMNKFMEIERDEFMEYGFEAKPEYRNGYYERTLRSTYGLLEGLRVPRVRSGTFYPSILEKGKHISTRTADGLATMYLKGVSTYKVGEVLKSLLGYGVSSSYVSTVTKKLQADVEAFYQRPLKDTVKILILDAVYIPIKDVLKSSRKPVFIAYGIHEKGQKEILHVRLGRSESESQWLGFMNELFAKGLTGKKLMLICTDGCPGLISALDMVYPYVKRQRCWAHKMRNVIQTCKKSDIKACVADAQKIYTARHKKEAVHFFKQFRNIWTKKNPAGVICLEKDLNELLAFYEYDQVLWKKIRTTNVIERTIEEIRRRTKVIGCFPDDNSCMRMVYALCTHFNTRWMYRRFFIPMPVSKAA